VASGGNLQFSFTSAAADIQFDVIHVQAGCAVPTTCAPGQFDNTYTQILGTSSASSGTGLPITLQPSGCTTSSQYVYFIFHAAVAKRIPISQTCPAPGSQ